MTERIPTPLAEKRLVYTAEELRRKSEGTWDATTMVSATSPEGAALLALQRASPEKLTVAEEIAVERLKNETVENGTTKAELLSPATAATSEAEGPKTETTPLGAMGSKRSRSGDHQLKKQKLPAGISELGRKRSPERMRLFLDSLAEDAVLIHATNKAGIHRKTPEYWLKGSAAGHDGYDLEWRGVTMKFDEHYISAMEEGGDIEEFAFRPATGYEEILTYKGRVSYKIDLVRWSLGHRGAAAYLKDENGDPVPETVRKYDPKMIRWLLARQFPDKYGERPKTDVTHKSGVLVVGVPSKTEVTVAQAELPPAKATASVAEGPKIETTPLGAMGSKRSRSGGRQLKKQKLPPEISELGRKRSPERMRIFLDSLAEYPALIYATKKAGIHRRTPEYWLRGSAAGHDGYDVEWRDVTMKFHEHYISAMDEGGGHLEEVAFRLATGYDEILTYKGRVSYKFDPVLLSLGHQGPDAYKKDKNGNPVPETVPKFDPKMARWLLERRLPDKYGKDRKMDVPHKAGVLVIGGPSKSEKLEKEFGGEQQIQDVEFDVDEGSEGEK